MQFSYFTACCSDRLCSLFTTYWNLPGDILRIPCTAVRPMCATIVRPSEERILKQTFVEHFCQFCQLCMPTIELVGIECGLLSRVSQKSVSIKWLIYKGQLKLNKTFLPPNWQRLQICKISIEGHFNKRVMRCESPASFSPTVFHLWSRYLPQVFLVSDHKLRHHATKDRLLNKTWNNLY